MHMKKFSIVSVIVLLIIALMPSVSAAVEIANTPSPDLKTDSNAINGLYDYDIQTSGDPLPAGATYTFGRTDGVALRAGSVDLVQLAQGHVRWTPIQTDAGTNQEYIVEIKDPNLAPPNDVIASKTFRIAVQGAALSVSDILIGGSGSEGERFNPKDDDFNSASSAIPKKTQKVSIKNTGDLRATVDSIRVTYAPEAGITDNADAYALTLLSQNVRNSLFDNDLIVEPSATVDSVSVEAIIAEHLPAVDADHNVRQWTIGTVTVTPTDRAVSVTDARNANAPALVKMQAQNMLEVKKIEVCATGATERCKRYDKGDTVENLKPNDKLAITVIVENNFDDKSNLDMDGKVEIDTDDTSVIDLDVNDEEDTVETNTETEFELSAAIENDADGTGTLQITVGGTDDNDAFHGEKWDLKFKVEREAHEISLSTLQLTPALVSCNIGSRDVQLQMDVRNIGKKKEKEVKVEIKADRGKFKLLKSETDLEVDKDDEIPVRFTFNVPTDVEPGTYGIEVSTYTKRTLLSNTETVMLTVPDCGFVAVPTAPEQQDEPKKQEEVVVTTPSAGTVPGVPTGTIATATPIAKKATKTFTASNAYIGALIAIIVVLLVVGGILVAMIVRKQ
ncbi:MAG: hypothetical protein Q7R76_00805 [Candidatus Woesearchaeota archaeon]|nr:hypothetical protein [Candidatus Woesearchaeota archaeon]